MEYNAGDKIQYRLFDEKGKAHWYDGLIHGVRQYEEPSGLITNITFLVDTGEDHRTDELVFDHRDREINKRVHSLTKKGKEYKAALGEVLKHSDLPDSKLDVEVVRQPLQIELPAEHIRSR